MREEHCHEVIKEKALSDGVAERPTGADTGRGHRGSSFKEFGNNAEQRNGMEGREKGCIVVAAAVSIRGVSVRSCGMIQ